MKEQAHSSMSEIGAAELQKLMSNTVRVGLSVGLMEHYTSYRAPTAPDCNVRSSSIDDLSFDNLSVTALDQRTMLSKPTWAHPHIIIGAQGADARDAGTILSKVLIGILKLLTRQSFQDFASTPSQN